MSPVSVIEPAGQTNLRRTVQTGQPGKRVDGDDLAPVFRIDVNDRALNFDISRFIQSVEYESAVDMSDLFSITIDNPGLIDDSFADWSAHKAFQPGNEASLYVGYGSADRPENFIGHCIWKKVLPDLPASGMPQLQLKGYDLSTNMMIGEGPIKNGNRIARPAVKRPVEFADNQGTVYSNVRHSEIVWNIADMYGMDKDIDETTKPDDFVVKKGQKHYTLVKGLANMNNRDFWVDYDPKRRKWVLHWKIINRNQQPQYILRYNQGDLGTILEAQPEYGIQDTVTTATISIFDEVNQRWISAIEIEDASGPDPIFRQGGGLEARNTAQIRPKSANKKLLSGKPSKAGARSGAARHQARDVIHEALDNASAFRIAAGGVAIEVLPPANRFRSPEEAATFLLRWFNDRRDNFIKVSGSLIGIESLRARQVHTLKGLGVRLDGDYYFTSVRHKVGTTYTCEFTANKVMVG